MPRSRAAKLVFLACFQRAFRGHAPTKRLAGASASEQLFANYRGGGLKTIYRASTFNARVLE